MFEYFKTYYGYDVQIGLDIESSAFIGFLMDGNKFLYSSVHDIRYTKRCNIDKYVDDVLTALKSIALEYAAINGTPYELSSWEQKEVDERKARGNFKFFEAAGNQGSGKA